jgi:hypothetical protein
MDADSSVDAGLQAGQTQLAASDGVPTQDDWRELARLIQTETDPHKMVELVQKLIARFDDEKLRKSLQASTDSK